jgi:hypothetical protein
VFAACLRHITSHPPLHLSFPFPVIRRTTDQRVQEEGRRETFEETDSEGAGPVASWGRRSDW